MIEVEVVEIEVDRESGVSILCLQGKQQRLSHEIRITVGPFEAKAIAYQMSEQRVPRPLTHDLLKDMIDRLAASVERVVIEDLRDGIFYARILLRSSGRQVPVDARPSDAIALAIRADAPIFVSPQVVEKTKAHGERERRSAASEKAFDRAELEDWKKWIDQVRPEDFTNPSP